MYVNIINCNKLTPEIHTIATTSIYVINKLLKLNLINYTSILLPIAYYRKTEHFFILYSTKYVYRSCNLFSK